MTQIQTRIYADSKRVCKRIPRPNGSHVYSNRHNRRGATPKESNVCRDGLGYKHVNPSDSCVRHSVFLRRAGFDAFSQHSCRHCEVRSSRRCTKSIGCIGDCFTAFAMTRPDGFPPSIPAFGGMMNTIIIPQPGRSHVYSIRHDQRGATPMGSNVCRRKRRAPSLRTQ
jgi:hypothetical protein